MTRYIHIDPGKLRSDAMGLKQEDLAAALGVSQRTLARWESGRITAPGLRMLALTAASMGLPVIVRGKALAIQVASLSATAPAPAPQAAPARPPEPPRPGNSGCPTSAAGYHPGDGTGA